MFSIFQSSFFDKRYEVNFLNEMIKSVPNLIAPNSYFAHCIILKKAVRDYGRYAYLLSGVIV